MDKGADAGVSMPRTGQRRHVVETALKRGRGGTLLCGWVGREAVFGEQMFYRCAQRGSAVEPNGAQ